MLGAMDREGLMHRIANANKRIAEGTRHIAQQKKLVHGMERLGRDTAQAARLLQTFEETVQLHIADRDKLLRDSNTDPT
jgi:hypothetical protein